MTSSKFSEFWTPSLPLSVPNPRNLPSFGANPPQCRRHMYMPPRPARRPYLPGSHSRGRRREMYERASFLLSSSSAVRNTFLQMDFLPFSREGAPVEFADMRCSRTGEASLCAFLSCSQCREKAHNSSPNALHGTCNPENVELRKLENKVGQYLRSCL